MVKKVRYRLGHPSLVVFELTLECNLDCLHCGSLAGKKRNYEVSTEEAIKICEDLAEIGTRGVALMGGELFLRKDWYEISKKIKDLGMKLSIATNGYFNPDKILPKLVKLEVDSISLGLDGMKETHNKIRRADDAFDKTLKFIDALQKEDLDPCPLTTFHKMNLKEFFEIRDLIIGKGLEWDVNTAHLIGRFPKDLVLSQEEFYELGLLIADSQKKYSKDRVFVGHNIGFHSKFIPHLSLFPKWTGCYAGKTNLGIKSNGDVNGCLPLPDKFTEDNVNNKTLIDIWNDPDSFKYIRQYEEKDLKGYCAECKFKKSCKGGCVLNSSTLTGDNHNDPYCFYRIEQEVFDRNVEEKIEEIIEKHSIDI